MLYLIIVYKIINWIFFFEFQYALVSQGMTSRNVWDPLLRSFGIKPAEDIPKEKESEIFPEVSFDTQF